MLLQKAMLIGAVWLSVSPVVTSAPAVNGESGHRRRQRKRQLRNISLSTETPHRSRKLHLDFIPPNLISDFVMFSTEKPRDPPRSVVISESLTPDELNVGSGDTYDHLTNSTTSRSKRSSRRAGAIRYSICDSVSSWNQKHKARTIMHNEVRVAQKIKNGRITVNQYFYETYCRYDNRPCTGIDTSRFFSVCETKHIDVLARVVNSLGQEQWDFIKIRGSCNCALYLRTDRQPSIIDHLDRIG